MKDVNVLTNNGVNVQQGLELFGDMEMYDETLNDFLDMVAEKLNHLESYKTSDMPNYAIDVHSLKSDSRYLGFTTLADLSYESEMKSKAGDVNFVLENHPKIMAEAKRIISVAQQYLGREVVDLVPNIGTSAEGSVSAAPVAQPSVAPAAVETPTIPTQLSPVESVTPVTPQVASVQAQMPSAPVAPTPVVAVSETPVIENPMTAAVTIETIPTQAPVTPVVTQAPVVEVQPQVVVQPVTPTVDAQPQVVVQPTVETVQPQAVVQPVAPAVTQPVAQPTVAVQPQEPTIEFFTPEPNPQNDIMNQALYNMNQTAQAPVAAVKKGIILVIDDSNLVANFVKKIFSKEYDVLIANDGVKGIEIINNPDVKSKVKACLLDLNMPNMNGFQVMDYFYQNGIFVKIPVAVISGAEDTESIDKANSYPIIDILAKPFTDRDVQKVVEKCLAAYF